jgi:hypothetical protein
MNRKDYRKKITRTITFTEYWSDSGEYVGGGISKSVQNINLETWVQLFDDLVMDDQSTKIGSTGRQQIHIGGTRRAFKELGTILLALSLFEPPKPGYNIHLDLLNENGEPTIHLVLQLPIREIKEKQKFEKTINIGTAIIGEDGKTKGVTTLPIKLIKKSEDI